LVYALAVADRTSTPAAALEAKSAEERLRSDPGSHHEVGGQAYERDPRMLIGRELYAESM